MQDDDTDKFTQAKGKPNLGGQLATGVTGLNYAEKGKRFIETNPGRCVTLVKEASSKRDAAGNAMKPTEESLRQWGAWYSYLRSIGYNTKLMVARDYWTVPAPWPHEFAAEATIAQDYVAGDLFYHKHTATDVSWHDTAAEVKRAVVASALGYDPSRKASKRDFVRPTPEDFDNLELKSPPRPASSELKNLLRDQGYGHLVDPPDDVTQGR
jgi:hypothetical protein